MAATARAGWEAVKESAGLLQAHTRLALFAVLEGVLALVVGLVMVAWVWSQDILTIDFATEEVFAWNGSLATGAVLLGVWFLVSAVVTSFVQGALAHVVRERMLAGGVQMRAGFARVWMLASPLLSWSLITAAVAIALQAFGESEVGSFFGGILSLAWGLITYFMIPVLVLEGEGIHKSLKQSARLFRAHWRPVVLGNVSFILAMLLIMLAVAGAGIALVVGAGFADSWFLSGLAMALAGLGALLTLVVGATIASILRVVLYERAHEEELPVPTS
jgi:Family of unknown function (DUF6159)